MRNLNEILNEGIFDNNATKDIDVVFANDLLKFARVEESEIDEKSKTIIIPQDYDCLYLYDSEDPQCPTFHGFPSRKWKIVNNRGKEFTSLKISCQIDDLVNIPDSIKDIVLEGSWDSNKKYTQDELDSFLKGCNDAKKLQTLTISCHLPKTDLSNLTLKLQRIHIFTFEKTDITVVFNPNQKVNVLEIGYNIGWLENLPADLKQISTKDDGQNLVRIMSKVDVGNNDISKIIFKGRHVSKQDIEAIVRNASGQEETEEKKRFDKNVKLLPTLKANDTDPTKDATGRSLKYGDVVYVINNPNSPFDVYVGVAGKMIKCLNSQSKPKFIVKMDVD